MRSLLLFVLAFVFFVVGVSAGGFGAIVMLAMAASSLLLALD
jgi:hypothetical protein